MTAKRSWSTLVTAVQGNVWYTSFIIALAILSVGILIYEWFAESASDSLLAKLLYIDLIIAYIFLLDFGLGLFFDRSFPSKSAYFKANWLNLVSSIPVTTEITQLLRVLRIWRAVRVFRVASNIWSVRKSFPYTK